MFADWLAAWICTRDFDATTSDVHAADLRRAADAAGYAIVPKVATDHMICQALDDHDRGKRSYSDVWAAMVQASPGHVEDVLDTSRHVGVDISPAYRRPDPRAGKLIAGPDQSGARVPAGLDRSPACEA